MKDFLSLFALSHSIQLYFNFALLLLDLVYLQDSNPVLSLVNTTLFLLHLVSRLVSQLVLLNFNK